GEEDGAPVRPPRGPHGRAQGNVCCVDCQQDRQEDCEEGRKEGHKEGRKEGGAAKRATKAAKSPAKKVSPRQALRSTRKVLEAKQQQARQPKPWEEASSHGGQVGGDGFQSTEAARRARELQDAGARMPAIHGSAGTRDRINQGKRDSKGGP